VIFHLDHFRTYRPSTKTTLPSFVALVERDNNMSSEKLTVAILVVSETASKDASTDGCIPALQETITTEGNGQWVVVDEKIVPDNVLDIQRYVTQWTDSDSNVNLILTSGGTGFATKDVTPEVG
jgi:gephyrin